MKEIIFEFDEEVWEVFFFLKGFVIVLKMKFEFIIGVGKRFIVGSLRN